MKIWLDDPSEVAGFQRALRAWFRRNARDLPWRSDPNPYWVWLSEIMLQQTRVEQGLPYFQRFIKALPNVEALAAAPEEAVLKLWEGLGYYSRARNLHHAARTIVAERDGRFPQTAAEWRALPGIGPYTANAIASIAFGEAAPVLDGNVMRVLSRLLNVRACIDDARTRARLWQFAERLLPDARPGDHNQAMMELGAQVCTPKNPRCPQCPARAQCRARALNLQDKRPVRRDKPAPPHYDMVAVAIERRGTYLLVQRPERGLLANLWEFPNTRLAENETHENTLARVLEELGITTGPSQCIGEVTHAFSHFHITVRAYKCSIARRSKTTGAWRWATIEEMAALPLPKTMHKILACSAGFSPFSSTP
jgi:A/G-specific adenine glycosylase